MSYLCFPWRQRLYLLFKVKFRERVIVSQGWKGEKTILLFPSHKMQFCLIIQHYSLYCSCKLCEEFLQRESRCKIMYFSSLAVFWLCLILIAFNNNLCLISWQQFISLLCLGVICKCLKQRCFFCILIISSLDWLLLFCRFSPLLSSVNYVTYLFQKMNCLKYKHQDTSSSNFHL